MVFTAVRAASRMETSIPGAADCSRTGRARATPGSHSSSWSLVALKMQPGAACQHRANTALQKNSHLNTGKAWCFHISSKNNPRELFTCDPPEE